MRQSKKRQRSTLESAEPGLAPESTPIEGPNGEEGIDPTESLNEPDQKRSRRTSWPLKSALPRQPSWSPPTGTRNGGRGRDSRSPKPHERRSRNDLKARPSKFLEGSMNDRVSSKPPPEYIQYAADSQNAAGRAGLKHTRGKEVATNEGEEEAPTTGGILRLGKSFAAAINPVGIWADWRQLWKDSFDEPRAHGTAGRLVKPKKAITRKRQDAAVVPPPARVSRDSGIDVDGYRTSTDRVPETSGTTSRPPVSRKRGRSRSPSVEPLPSLRGKFIFKKPSTPNLKKVKSESNVASISSRGVPMTSAHSGNGPTKLSNLLHKQPSRKDLEKQRKLTKRVSDLETQLHLARRELNETLERVNPTPTHAEGRHSFVPGALASLPSEGILSAQQTTPSQLAAKVATVVEDSEDVVKEDFGGMMTIPKRLSSTGAVESASKESTRRKLMRKTDDASFKPSLEANDDVDSLASSKAAPKQKRGRPRKSQKTTNTDSPSGVRKTSGNTEVNGEDEGADSRLETADTSSVTAAGKPQRSRARVDRKLTDILTSPGFNKSTTDLSKPPEAGTKGQSRSGQRRSISSPPPPAKSKALLSSSMQIKTTALPGATDADSVGKAISLTPDELEIPPVPKLPQGIDRIVKLAQGDVEGGDGDDAGNVSGGAVEMLLSSAGKKREDFEWPEDIF
ncbi:MAG: hypothetical protein M1825_001855 [Sarcosagium campestre]|nr:MAG: hypothetical protein M1825_001855 [Sarcosagium campestre]